MNDGNRNRHGVNGGAAGRVVVVIPLISASAGMSVMGPAVTLAVGLHVWERARGLVDGISEEPADAEVRHELPVMATTSNVRDWVFAGPALSSSKA